MKKTILLAALVCCIVLTKAQSVAINTDGSTANSSAILDLKSSSKGFLLPRMTAAQRTAIATPASGLLIYQTDAPVGLYYYDGSTWKTLGAAPSPTALANYSIPHFFNNNTASIYTTPFSFSSGATLQNTLTFFIPANTSFTINFYSFDNDPLTYELFNVVALSTSVNYTEGTTTGATATTAAWSSGAPTTGSFTYTATANQLLTVKVTRTGGGNTVSTGGHFTLFTVN